MESTKNLKIIVIKHFRALLEAGVDADSRDYRDYTPLHVSAKAGSEANTNALLDFGADPNAEGKECEILKFSHSISHLMRSFIFTGRKEGRGGRKTPLHRARTKKIVQILLAAGADPMATMTNNKDGQRDELSAFEVKRIFYQIQIDILAQFLCIQRLSFKCYLLLFYSFVVKPDFKRHSFN